MSEQSHLITWGGPAMRSSQRAFWKVMVWDRSGVESPWSNAMWFETRLLAENIWRGMWIGLRSLGASTTLVAAWKHFAVQPGPKLVAGVDYLRARPLPVTLQCKMIHLSEVSREDRACISVLGYGELFVNGVRVSDPRFAPAVPRYRDHALFVTHDITPYLRVGNNTFGVVLAPGLAHHTGTLRDGAGYDADWNYANCPEERGVESIIKAVSHRADGKLGGTYRSKLTKPHLNRRGLWAPRGD